MRANLGPGLAGALVAGAFGWLAWPALAAWLPGAWRAWPVALALQRALAWALSAAAGLLVRATTRS
jgi:hypothetical protein